MNSIQIESWALRIIDCFKRGQPNEDFLVELKREWIAEDKAARRIAGHANAARGENILWLIGIDEKESSVRGVSPVDLASWYPAVEAYFNELAPRMTPLNIPIDEVIVVALLFETDRAPFVIKNPVFGSSGGGSVELEIPWRENTSVRSARRSDLIRLLAPLELLPEIKILNTQLNATIEGRDSVGNHHSDALDLDMELYIIPKSNKRIVIPFHQCRVEFKILGLETLEASWIILKPSRGMYRGSGMELPGSLTIQSTADEIIVDGPGKILLGATAKRPSLLDTDKKTDVCISIYLRPTHSDCPIVLVETLPYPEERLPS